MSSTAITQPEQSVEDFDVADAAFRDRFALLRIRAGVVGVSGIVGWMVALVGLLIFGNPLAEWFGRTAIGGGIDIPRILFRVSDSDVNGLALFFGFAAAGFVGIAGSLKRGMRRWEIVIWVLVLIGVGGSILYSHSRLFVVANERAAAEQWVRVAEEGDLGKATALLPIRSRAMESQYVLAQMAFSAGDEKALQAHAEPLLRKLDRLLLRIDESSAGGVPDLRIDVLQRLDLALYGAPHSQVSLAAAATRPSGAVSEQGWRGADVVGVVAALLLAWLSTGALLLFHRMAERLLRLRAWLGIA